MKDRFEMSLLESGSLIKRGTEALLNNMGRAIAIITLLISALVLFTDIGFADFSTERFTSTMAVMLLASYLMYFSMSDSGEKRGEESEEFKRASKRCAELSEKIGGDMIGALREFCKSYSEEELAYRKANIIICYGYGESEYERYKSGGACDKKARRIFKRADRQRAIPLTPRTLLAKERVRERSELINPENGKLIAMILKLIPTTVCMLVTVSVMLTAKDDLSAQTVIDGIFKLASLPIIGFRGYVSGYSYTRHTLTLWADTKARLLDAFLKSAKQTSPTLN